MNRVAILAAMPGELKPLVRGWRHARSNGIDLWRCKFDEGEWIAACAGAGQNAATRAFAEIEKDGSIEQVFSVGWAGALSESFVRGKAYRVSGVVDVQTGERFETAASDSRSGICLATSPKVADTAEKQRLAAAYHAGLVDMEAAAVARLAQMRGVPFHCVKGVSDGLTDNLPDFNRFISPLGHFQLARFVLFAVFSPWRWPSLVRMGENSKRASQSIAELLRDFLDEQGHIRERNGYPNFKR
jgi:adenosylhomocysteine nucleosidase